MNVFRFIGDMSHLASFFFLLQRIYTKRNVAGISLKTLELYLLVFLTRYLDLFFSYISLYNSTMKILYIGMSGAVVYLIRKVEPWKSSYKEDEDTFLHLKFGVAVRAFCLFSSSRAQARESQRCFKLTTPWA